MSIQNLRAFRQMVESDPELQAQIRNRISAGQTHEIVALGKTHGFDFSVSDLKEVYGKNASEPLSDFELELVSGGLGETQLRRTAEK